MSEANALDSGFLQNQTFRTGWNRTVTKNIGAIHKACKTRFVIYLTPQLKFIGFSVASPCSTSTDLQVWFFSFCHPILHQKVWIFLVYRFKVWQFFSIYYCTRFSLSQSTAFLLSSTCQRLHSVYKSRLFDGHANDISWSFLVCWKNFPSLRDLPLAAAGVC